MGDKKAEKSFGKLCLMLFAATATAANVVMPMFIFVGCVFNIVVAKVCCFISHLFFVHFIV